MLRLPPPRGRVSRLMLLAALAMSVFFVAPAGAAQTPEITVARSVTGRGQLAVTVVGVDAPLTVEVRDAAGNTSSWQLAAGTRSVALDLDTPDAGVAPANGKAAVNVAVDGGTSLLSQLVTLDRDPATPQLTAVVRGQRVGLFWNAVAGPGTITYRLQRVTTGTDWQTISETTSASGHTDRDLAPGRYRYRLMASVPGADGTPNTSGVTATQIRITAPEPAPQPEAEPDPAPSGAQDEPSTERGGKGPSGGDSKDSSKPRNTSRDVAATGNVRGPVSSPAPSSNLAGAPPAKTPLVSATAQAPAVSGMPATQTVPVPVQTPEVAPAASPTPLAYDAGVAALDYFPVIVPPAGALAIEAAGSPNALAGDVVTVLAGAAFLGLAATGLRRRRSAPTT